jgi:hypothetical protein
MDLKELILTLVKIMELNFVLEQHFLKTYQTLKVFVYVAALSLITSIA